MTSTLTGALVTPSALAVSWTVPGAMPRRAPVPSANRVSSPLLVQVIAAAGSGSPSMSVTVAWSWTTSPPSSP